MEKLSFSNLIRFHQRNLYLVKKTIQIKKIFLVIFLASIILELYVRFILKISIFVDISIDTLYLAQFFVGLSEIIIISYYLYNERKGDQKFIFSKIKTPEFKESLYFDIGLYISIWIITFSVFISEIYYSFIFIIRDIFFIVLFIKLLKIGFQHKKEYHNKGAKVHQIFTIIVLLSLISFNYYILFSKPINQFVVLLMGYFIFMSSILVPEHIINYLEKYFMDSDDLKQFGIELKGVSSDVPLTNYISNLPTSSIRIRNRVNLSLLGSIVILFSLSLIIIDIGSFDLIPAIIRGVFVINLVIFLSLESAKNEINLQISHFIMMMNKFEEKNKVFLDAIED